MTLYVPGPALREGKNEVVVLELEAEDFMAEGESFPCIFAFCSGPFLLISTHVLVGTRWRCWSWRQRTSRQKASSLPCIHMARSVALLPMLSAWVGEKLGGCVRGRG